MSFSLWRLAGVIFIASSVFNLTRGQYDVHPWLVYLDIATLIIWPIIVIFEGVKKK